MQQESTISKIEKRVYDALPHEPETMAATLFIIGMAAYYMWRMFAITPKYDELYSYCNFIVKGPLYCALTWPSNTNHVGYSVLSSFLDFFGNSYIGLRGISYICAVCNLVLVYRICKRYYSHAMPFGALVLYASMQVVNEYSVQGRGYTLGTFCFLLSVYAIGDICKAIEEKKLLSFAIVFCIVFGVYTVPSSIYWVVPVCLSCMIFLFINGFRSRRVYNSDSENTYLKRLNGFISATGAGVLITLFLYTALWLSVGASEIAKDEASSLFGEENSVVLVRSPVKALGTGFSYMRDNRLSYETSVELFKEQFSGWLVQLLDYMIPGMWLLLAIFIIAGMAIMITECFRHFEYSRTVINLMAIVNILYVLLILITTHRIPPLKGFGYGSFIMTICVLSTIEKLMNVIIRNINRFINNKMEERGGEQHRENERADKKDSWYRGLYVYIPVLLITVLFLVRIVDPAFNQQIDHHENVLYNTMYIADIPNKKNPCVLDADQKYLMKFIWNIDCEKTDVTGADVVILEREMENPDFIGDNNFKFYQSYDTIDWEYLDNMHIQYENDEVVLYTKQKER